MVADVHPAASTKSAPQRSGDPRLPRTGLPAPASTKSAPQRSGDRGAGPRPPCASRLNEVRSPKERRRRGRGGRPRSPAGLNEVRSPKKRRRPRRRRGSGPGGPGLNEVRSPKERRRGRVVAVDNRELPQRSPLPKGAETDPGECVAGADDASTKSAPQRSGDVLSIPIAASPPPPQRSPLPKGAETSLDRRRSPHTIRRPQRSPLPKGAETGGPPGSVGDAECAASTKSAPQRSGDTIDNGPTVNRPDPASTKSAPQRSGDPASGRRGAGPARRLNEVRSPKERRRSTVT